ncbi:hypothetical protein Tco_1478603, partial [Tanacetum coccineum]
SIYTDQRGTMAITTVFDEILPMIGAVDSRRVMIHNHMRHHESSMLKLKNFKKGAALKLFKARKQESGNNNNNEENLDIVAIIAQQLQTILPHIVTQVTNNVNNANGGNGGNNGCTYKGFMAGNPKEYDGKGGAIALT